MGKYDNIFLPLGDLDEHLDIGKWIKRMDSSTVPGSNYYAIHWCMPGHYHPDPVGHPPHIHVEDELLFHIGTNPDDPTDLGAEIEFFIGEEMERHVINKSCVVFIPGGLLHSPWTITRCDRPWIVVQVQQTEHRTEKFYPEKCSPELRESINWDHWKDENTGEFKIEELHFGAQGGDADKS